MIEQLEEVLIAVKKLPFAQYPAPKVIKAMVAIEAAIVAVKDLDNEDA